MKNFGPKSSEWLAYIPSMMSLDWGASKRINVPKPRVALIFAIENHTASNPNWLYD